MKLLGGMIHGQLDKQLKYKKFGYLPKHYRKSFKSFAIANVLMKEIMENKYLATSYAVISVDK